MRSLIFIILPAFISIAGTAQSNLTVRILDSLGIPVSKATVSLHKADRKLVLKNSITDTAGYAFFSAVESNDYFISSTAIGFQPGSSPVFSFDPKLSNPPIQTLLLGRIIRELAAVTITVVKPLIEMNEDKIIYNVESDPSLQGFSAAEALSKVPFISVDGNGGIQLKGQISFQILLNGKQTSMFAVNPGDVLKSFPANTTIPFARRSKIEAGIRGIFRDVNSTYTSFIKNLPTDIFLPDPGNTNELIYTQNVVGLYTVYTYSLTEKRFVLKAGGRLEKTKVNGHFISSNTKVEQDYYSFLPSLSLNKTFKNGKRFSFAWNWRLARPGLSFLNPFKDNRDPVFLVYGNERLKPEFAQNLEIALASFSQKITYSFALTASFISGGIQRFLVFKENSGITEQTYGNIGKTQLYGINGYLSFKAGKKISLIFNSNLNHASIKNTMLSGEKRNGFYGAINSSCNVDISEKLLLFNNINYNTSALQLQGQNGDYLFYNTGGTYRAFKKKLMISLAIHNVFNKYWRTDSEFASASFIQETSVWRPAKALSLGLRYSFGKLKENTSKKKGVVVDDSKQDVN